MQQAPELFIVRQKGSRLVRARWSFVKQNCTTLAPGLRPELGREGRAQRLRLTRVLRMTLNAQTPMWSSEYAMLESGKTWELLVDSAPWLRDW